MFKKLILILIATNTLLGCKNNTSEKAMDNTTEIKPANTTANEQLTLFQLVEQQSIFNNLFKLTKQAQLVTEIQNLENATFFAPTNTAINKLSDDAYANLRLPENLKWLQSILTYHIVEGEMDSDFLISTIKANNNQPYRLQTIQGGYISLTIKNGQLIITDENASQSVVSKADIKATNGVMHGIETLLIPVDNQ